MSSSADREQAEQRSDAVQHRGGAEEQARPAGRGRRGCERRWPPRAGRRTTTRRRCPASGRRPRTAARSPASTPRLRHPTSARARGHHPPDPDTGAGTARTPSGTARGRCRYGTMARVRAVVQVVDGASVTVDGQVVGSIEGAGLLVLLGVTHGDGAEQARRLATKIWGLRILADETSASDLGAPVLVVSQFTLYADTSKGRRPGWSAAAPGPVAEPVVDAVLRCAARARCARADGRVRRAHAGLAGQRRPVHTRPGRLTPDRSGYAPASRSSCSRRSFGAMHHHASVSSSRSSSTSTSASRTSTAG